MAPEHYAAAVMLLSDLEAECPEPEAIKDSVQLIHGNKTRTWAIDTPWSRQANRRIRRNRIQRVGI